MTSHLHTIKTLERQNKVQEIAQILFIEGIILSDEIGPGKSPKMRYSDFVSKTSHMLNKDFYNQLISEVYSEDDKGLPKNNYDLTRPHPLLISAYRMIGGKGELMFPREEKYEIEGAMMRLMFTPAIYLNSRMVCEAIEEKISKPLFMTGLTPLEIMNPKQNSTTSTSNQANSSGCAGILIFLISIPFLIYLTINYL